MVYPQQLLYPHLQAEVQDVDISFQRHQVAYEGWQLLIEEIQSVLRSVIIVCVRSSIDDVIKVDSTAVG